MAYIITCSDKPDFRLVVDTMAEAIRVIECEQVLRAAKEQIAISNELLGQ